MENKNNTINSEENSAYLETSFVDPKKIIEVAGIKRGDKVADFGCGGGYFSIPTSEAVGETGEVFAFDILP